jgi:hypothetical protein
MSTVVIPRSSVTVEEVSAVLRDKLGSHYTVKPFVTSNFHREALGYKNSILVRRNWFVQANIRVVPRADDTEIFVGSGANVTPIGLLLNTATIVRKVHQILEHSAELAKTTEAVK